MKCHRGTSTSMVRILTVSFIFFLFKLVEDAGREKKYIFKFLWSLVYRKWNSKVPAHRIDFSSSGKREFFFFCFKKMYKKKLCKMTLP